MDINSKELEKFFHQMELKYGVNKETVRRIVSSEFECVKNVMKKVDSYNGFFPYIRLPYLCTFLVKKKKQEFFTEKSKKTIQECLSSKTEK